jgi:quinol-cytochrome oxidoreductase complex cytochrome b subunit
MYDEWQSENADIDDDVIPYWTWKRVVLLLIVLITLIAFLIYTFSPLVSDVINRLAPEPPPIDLPSQRA